MNDERKQKPSCSSFERYMHCPGSFRAEQFSEPEGQVAPEASEGTLVHEAIAAEAIDSLPVDLQSVAWECVRLRELIVQDFGGDPEAGQYFVERERRLWWRDEAFSGACDHVVIDGERGLIVDYKTGHVGAAPAYRNLQLAGYAVLMAYYYGLTEVHVAIVQPRAYPKTSVTVYDADALQKAESAIQAMLQDIQSENAPRKAGEHCQYCRARYQCPTAARTIHDLTVIEATGRLPQLSGEELSNLLDHSSAAEKIIKAIKDHAKARMKAGDEIPGYQLKPGAVRQKITDPETVYQRVTNMGVPHDRFMGCVTIAKTALKSAMRRSGHKGRELDKTLEAVLEGCVEETQSEPSIVKDKA